METKGRYTANLIFNERALADGFTGDNLDKLTAQVIYQVEQHYPNAVGEIRDNDKDEIIGWYRRNSHE